MLEAGCDEAGRGCLAGPVFAAAVIFPLDYHNRALNDSKKLSAKQRDKLRIVIEKEALCWSVQQISPNEIDKINILQASMKAIHLAVNDLRVQPEWLLIDGKYFVPHPHIPHQCIVKGDGKYLSIAAASILAKTHRDEHMLQLHQKHPNFGWDHNKGYPTVEHRKAVFDLGPTSEHRKSFKLFPDANQISLFDL